MIFKVSLLLTLVTLVPLSLAQSHSCILPPQASHVIEQKFPGWRAKDLSDLDEDDRKVLHAENAKACAGIAVGHFESVASIAYAILLIRKSAAEVGFKVIVLSRLGEGNVVRMIQHSDTEDGRGYGLVISREPPGKKLGFDTSKAVRLKLDGVNVEYLEKSSVLYYWSNGRYRSLVTSD